MLGDVAAGATAGLLGGLLPRPRPITVVAGPQGPPPPPRGRDGPRDRPYRGYFTEDQEDHPDGDDTKHN